MGILSAAHYVGGGVLIGVGIAKVFSGEYETATLLAGLSILPIVSGYSSNQIENSQVTSFRLSK